jgi:hypothetical protein
MAGEKQLSDGDVDGTILGQSAADKLGFYGKAPVAQPAAAAQSAITTGATLVAAVALLIEVQSALATLGLIKGAA